MIPQCFAAFRGLLVALSTLSPAALCPGGAQSFGAGGQKSRDWLVV